MVPGSTSGGRSPTPRRSWGVGSGHVMCVGTRAVERKEPVWEPGLPAPRGPRGPAVGTVPRESRNKGLLGGEWGPRPWGLERQRRVQMSTACVGRATRDVQMPPATAHPVAEHQQNLGGRWPLWGWADSGSGEPGSGRPGREGLQGGWAGPGKKGLVHPGLVHSPREAASQTGMKGLGLPEPPG